MIETLSARDTEITNLKSQLDQQIDTAKRLKESFEQTQLSLMDNQQRYTKLENDLHGTLFSKDSQERKITMSVQEVSQLKNSLAAMEKQLKEATEELSMSRLASSRKDEDNQRLQAEIAKVN